MKGDLLRKYAGMRETADVASQHEGGEVDDLLVFGLLRGIRERAIMLELRRKDGVVEAFPYTYLSHARFDPSDGIELHFGGKVVTIKGRNLGAEVRPNVRLFDAILRHRVPFVQEADGPSAIKAAREAVVIDQILVK